MVAPNPHAVRVSGRPTPRQSGSVGSNWAPDPRGMPGQWEPNWAPNPHSVRVSGRPTPRQAGSLGSNWAPNPQAVRVSGIQLGAQPPVSPGQWDPTGRPTPSQSGSVGSNWAPNPQSVRVSGRPTPEAVRVSGIQLGTQPPCSPGQWDPTGYPTPSQSGVSWESNWANWANWTRRPTGPCSPTRAHVDPAGGGGATVTSGMNSIQLGPPRQASPCSPTVTNCVQL
jgi:hypothetical protein